MNGTTKGTRSKSGGTATTKGCCTRGQAKQTGTQTGGTHQGTTRGCKAKQATTNTKPTGNTRQTSTKTTGRTGQTETTRS